MIYFLYLRGTRELVAILNTERGITILNNKKILGFSLDIIISKEE